MALTGSTQNRRPGAGVYPGSGVAQGGQQGRSRVMHNGVGARSGGRTPGASQPRVTGTFAAPRPGQLPAGSTAKPGMMPRPSTRLPPGVGQPLPEASRPTDGYLWVVKNGKKVRMHRSAMSPDLLAAALKMGMNKPNVAGGGGAVGGVAAAPVAGAPPIPAYEPQLRDSAYFMDLAGAQQGFDDALNPINAELARLRYNGIGGKTLYDTMYQDAEKNFGYQVRDTRDQMHKVGLGRSGRFDRAAAGLGSEWTNTQRELDESVGSTAINRLETQAAQQRAAFSRQQAALEMAAAAREQERRAAYNQSLYGMTIMPEE